jgi:pyruvate/2-oxoacid:ferredoxin oxidoreductase beta subunit
MDTSYKGDRPATDYLRAQGRFKHLTDADFKQIQLMVDEDWNLLLRKIELFSDK